MEPTTDMRRTELSEVDKERIETTKRLCLFHNSRYSAKEALEFEESKLTRDLLVYGGVKWDNVVAAGLSISDLKQRHFACADLRKIGMDAVDLSEGSLARQVVDAYGVEEVVSSFIQTPTDAVNIYDSEGARILDLHLPQLLELCAASPGEAASLLTSSGPPSVYLNQLSIDLLLNTALRGRSLIQLGLSVNTLIHHLPTVPTPVQIRALGLERAI